MTNKTQPDQIKLRAVAFPRGTTIRSIWALLMREFATSNARTSGGVLWAFASPIATIILLTVIFSAGFRAPPVGDVFAIFYATGILPFTLYSTVASQLGNCVQSNRRLLRYPRITIIDTIIARLIFTVLIQITVGLCIYTAILTIWETKTILDFGPIVRAMGTALIFGTGVGMFNITLFQMFPSYQQIWNIATAPLFLISCVIFPYSDVPAPFDAWLAWNPVVHFVETNRTGFYHGYQLHGLDVSYPIWLGILLSVLGMILINQGRARLLAR